MVLFQVDLAISLILRKAPTQWYMPMPSSQEIQLMIEGQLKFAENPQMKLDEDLFQANMNTVELEGNKVLVRPSQTESTKGKEVIIGEERRPRMIRPKNKKNGRWKKNERSKP
jgi:hypothetical protein